jgi:ABC-type polysaccharide/polyol phosphate transport system ATPase subunit
MPELAIRAESLVKRYALHASPRERLLDVLGLRLGRSGERAETAAIDNISFEVRRGEKLGIIGRNGSGKSTLLGLVSGVIQPSAGTIVVTGQVHPLLSLGAGFSDEMTGAENARGYLAQIGIGGAALRRRVDEVAAFAELGEYFDQPMRTYSSGMRMRLTFAAATCVEPDVLLLDEVLSVGDAYFISKSLERMRALCSGAGTTLVLVSHSIGLVTELCERVIWLERGRIRMDGEPESVRGAYQQFMRAEEENRLQKLRSASAARWNRRAQTTPTDAITPPRPSVAPAVGHASGQIETADRQPPAPGLVIAELVFERDGVPLAALALEGGAASPLIPLEGFESGNWGPVRQSTDGPLREYLCYGSPFHKLPFLVHDEALARRLFEDGVEAVLRCQSGEDIALNIRLFDGADRQAAAALPIKAATGFQTVRAALAPEPVEPPPDPKTVSIGRFGTRRMEITDAAFLDASGVERLVFSAGSRFTARLRYRINDPTFDERATVVLVFEKDGYLKTHRFYLNQKRFAAAERREGEIRLVADPLLLAPGEYAVTIAVHTEGHATRRTPRDHFTVSSTVYDMYFRGFQITVFETWHTTLLGDLVFQHPARWTVDGQNFEFLPATD